MKKVLLINPSGAINVFAKSPIRVAIPNIPYLSLATVGATLQEKDYVVEILDLALSRNPGDVLLDKLVEFRPDSVGITATTPLFPELVEITKTVKNFNKNIFVMGGGPHPSTLPKESVENSLLDVVVVGEGDYTVLDILSNKKLGSIKGICYRENSKIKENPKRPLIKNIDELPYPAWNLFDLKNYRTPRLNCMKNPVGAIETSRGCLFNCVYCNKGVFGKQFRMKSVKRVVDEMEYMLDYGFKEIHVWDDNFTTDLDRAKGICDEIVKRGLDFPWNIYNGIRVNSVDKEFFEKAYAAGCYRVSLGVESGNQEILNKINKGITLDQARKAFKLARETGVETMGFFMLGLPGETEETMQQTIDFAREVNPVIPKVAMLMPLPGTKIFDDWNEKGYIKTLDWSKYVFHAPTKVYNHPNLSWDKIHNYYKKFYLDLYLNPEFIYRRLKRDITKGELIWDAWYLLKTLRYGLNY